MNVTTVYLVVDDPFNSANFYNQRDLVAGFSIGSFQRFFEILGFPGFLIFSFATAADFD